MKMKRKTVLITVSSFVTVLVLIYLGIMFSLPPVQQKVLVTASDILGEPSEAFKPILAKIERGEPLTQEEQRVKQEEHIKNLAQYDAKAAAYAREMLEQGYLESSANQYLLQKEKEFQQWLTDEMQRYREGKYSRNNIEGLTTPE